MMNTVTLCMSMDLAETVKKKSGILKTNCLKLLQKDQKKPERVFHMNLNFSP